MNDLINITNLNKKYNTLNGEVTAIENLNITIKDNEIVSIIGPSGCGKSTILSIISNIEKETSGIIKKKENLKIGYMLQSDALFPFLTIYDNCCIGLKIKKNNNKEYIDYLLKYYNLEDFKNMYPKSLSGGMKQRVACLYIKQKKDIDISFYTKALSSIELTL